MTIKVKISNPLIDDLELTYLSQDISNTVSIPVISTDFFASPDDLILIGNKGYDNSEIRTIDSISENTITTTIAAKNSHITGEKITKLIYNKIKLYKKSITDSEYSLLTTVDITYNSPDQITLYTDTVGVETDSYKAQYYNSVNSDESELSSAFTGTNVSSSSSYISINQFREMSGVSDSEVPDSVLNEFLALSTRDLKRECFAWGREVQIEKETVGSEYRYYFPFSMEKTQSFLGYLTDWNLDGLIDTNDITIYEKDSTGEVRTDITSQVDTLDTELGYFTLNSGYPSESGYKVYATFGWMNFLITDTDTQFDVKRYLMHKTMCYLVEWYRNQIRRGIIKQTLGGLTVEKNLAAWETLYKYHEEKANKYVNRFKPILFGQSADQSVWLGSTSRYYGYGNRYGTGYYSGRTNRW